MTSDKYLCKSDGGEKLPQSWGELHWLVSAPLGNSETTFGRVTIFAGQSNPRHRHPNCDEILHVLSGRIEHSLEDETFTMEAGDTISIPQGLWHNARAIGEEDALMVISFSSAHRETEGEI
jgi:quercetin dioxygenase-like cupin family protein